INYVWGGLNVWGYHALNLGIHILVASTLFAVLRRTLTGDVLCVQFGRTATGLALAVAVIWMVHPLLTESVTYVCQRSELLMGLFLLLTLYCLIRGDGTTNRNVWYAAGVLSCFLGAGSKEVMAAAPIVVLVYDR